MLDLLQILFQLLERRQDLTDTFQVEFPRRSQCERTLRSID